ncbi:tol-pal system YbgF family protein [Streptomyces sp. NPDC051555]|uniref:tol-pal system YbgF family protein n=1 Tax=Streptomyces sp. NPDC051555 TaxID=3365657 RepID=UPI0037A57B01
MPRTPNTRLRGLLEEADWSGAQLAAALRHLAAEHRQQLGCDRSMVSRWLSGTTPRPPVPALLLEVLSRRLRRPVSAVEAGLSRAPSTVFELSWEADPLRRLSALTRAELDPTRRRLLNAGMYSLAALALPEAWQPHTRPSPVSPRATGRAGRAEIEQMQTMTRVLAEAAQAHGPDHVRTALAAYLGHDVSGYLQASATGDQHRRLLSGAAQLTLLLGTMCAGSGADAPAQHYHHTAAQLATEADDTATYAIALRTMSAHAHDLGHHTPAVLHLAERAVTLTRRTSPIIAAYAQAHLAVIQAHHNKHAALTALAAAERLHELADTTPGPFTHYPAGALHYQRAQTLATLGDTAGATGALTASLRLRTPGERHARALTQARLAETLLTQGHLEAALTHWQAFLDTYPTLHSAHATRRLDVMRRLLHPHQRHRATALLLTRAAPLR